MNFLLIMERKARQGLIPALEAKEKEPKISSSQLSLFFTLQRRQECCPSLLQETPVGEKQ